MSQINANESHVNSETYCHDHHGIDDDGAAAMAIVTKNQCEFSSFEYSARVKVLCD